MNAYSPYMYEQCPTVDREIFAIKKFSPVAWTAKIKHAKIKYTSLQNRQAAKIKRAKIYRSTVFGNMYTHMWQSRVEIFHCVFQSRYLV